jgi:Tfp pilus assembly protein PilF
MQEIYGKMMWRGARRSRFGLVGLLCMLSVVAGCATIGKVEPEPVAQAVAATASGPAVTRFDGGREGFQISEQADMSAEDRSRFQQAVALLNSGRDAEAIALLEPVVATAPGVTAPYIDIAMAYRHTGKSELAEKHLKTALALVPGHPVASNEYGLLLRQSGRFAEARTVYEQALTQFPEYLPLHKNLGILCELYLNDQAGALEHYRLYSEASPEDEEVKVWIADLSLRAGAQ